MNSKMNTKKTLLASMVGLFAAAGGASSAMAQGDEAATAQGRIDEIIVTANKREQSLQDTAMSISALSNDTIDKRGLVGMADYLPTIPGVSMQDRGASQNNIVIRGIASDPQIETSNVGVYFGEIPLTNLGSASASDLSGSADLKLVDVDRIEVLRGPQGTLYGSGSMGGTVKVVPAKPNLDELEGKLTVNYSQTGEAGGDNSMVQGVLSIPIIEDVLAVRAVAYSFDNSGFINNISGSNAEAQAALAGHIALGGVSIDRHNVGNHKTDGYRITTLWEPTEDLSVTLAYINQELEQDGYPEVNLFLDDKFAQTRLRAGQQDIDEFLRNDLQITNLVLEYELDWGTFLSASSWVDYKASQGADISFLFSYPVSQGGVKEVDMFTQEIRFSSNFSGPIQLLAGMYYEDIDPPSLNISLWSGDPELDDIGFGVNPFFERKQSEQKALFGELSYQISEKLTGMFGVRIFDYEQNYNNSNPDSFFSAAKDIHNINKESGQVYKLNLSYTIDENTLVYGQWSEGFRLGRPQLPLPDQCDADNDGRLDGPDTLIQDNIESDTLDSFEIGTKSSWLDNKLIVNTTVYSIDWDGIPKFVTGSCLTGIYANVGKSKSEGFELEGNASLSDNLNVQLGVSYNDSYLTEDSPIGNKGDNMPGSANFNAAIGVSYNLSLGGYDGYIRGDYNYIGKYYNNFDETGTSAGGYGQVHLKSGIKIENFEIDLFVNNLTNSDNLTWVESLWGSFGLTDRGYRLRPRTVGLNISYRI